MADREVPSYFPDRPAEEQHDIGRWEWEEAHTGGLVEFTRRNDDLIAQFDDSLSVYGSVRQYARTLPKDARPKQDGHTIRIRNASAVEEWFPFELNTGDQSDTDDSNTGFFSCFLRS